MAGAVHTEPLVGAAEFPTIAHTGVAYLDSGATSQTPRAVIDAMTRYYETSRASG
jgi:cysteine desulfurase/selenocysteine lyase